MRCCLKGDFVGKLEGCKVEKLKSWKVILTLRREGFAVKCPGNIKKIKAEKLGSLTTFQLFNTKSKTRRPADRSLHKIQLIAPEQCPIQCDENQLSCVRPFVQWYFECRRPYTLFW